MAVRDPAQGGLRLVCRFSRLIGITFAIVLALVGPVIAFQLWRALDDKEMLSSASACLGKSSTFDRSKLGPPSIVADSPDEFRKLKLDLDEDTSEVYVYGAERGLVCVVFNSNGVAHAVKHRGSL